MSEIVVTARILFTVLIAMGLYCTTSHEAWAFGRMGGPYPEDPYKWLHLHLGWLGSFTIFAILLKHIFYQGMFANRMYISWLGVHILIVVAVALALNFLQPELVQFRHAYVLCGGIAGFSFLAAYSFERWAFSREVNGKLTRSMSYTLIGVNLLYALILAIVASCLGPVYDA